MAIQAQKGTKDMLPSNAYKWQYIEDKLRKISAEYGIREIRTPMFEATELFKRGVGETTDVVQKEMYTFEDKGGRSITLKPEGTAPAVRALLKIVYMQMLNQQKCFISHHALDMKELRKED